MPIPSTLAISGASAIIKRILDDLYVSAKEVAVNRWARSRSDLKEAAIAKSLTRITKIKTLWNVEKEVSLYDFYYPAKIEFPGGATKQIASLRELGIVRNYVLQGTAGQGKSVFLRYLTGQELHPEHTSGRIPIFVELRRLRPDLPLEALILQTLEKYKIPNSPESWSYLASSGNFILLLDAFDEVDPTISNRTIDDIESLADLHQDKLQIIITSRPDADIQRSPRFRVLKLAPLDKPDHLPFLQRICPDKEQARSLSKVLSSSSTDIKELLTTPLMMTLLVILYKSLQTIPDTLPKFYEELFDVLFYRHDQSKPGFRRKRYTQLDDSRVKKLFSALCFVVRLESLGTLTNDKLRESVAKAATACNENVDPDKFRDELTKTVCLMLQDGLEYSFIHKSVIQYYAASFVRGSADAFAERFYALAAKEPGGGRWDLELKFLAEIDTYRYMKWRELPLLNRCAESIGYSFTTDSLEASSRLNEYMFRKISLVARSNASENPGRNWRDGLQFFGWSRLVEDDPVIEVLSRPWAHRLMIALNDDNLTKQLRLKTPPPKRNDDREVRQLTGRYKDAILAALPKIGEESLAEIQRRYDYAVSIVSTEEKKSDMLTTLLG